MSTNEEIKAITFADFLKQHLEDRQLSAEWLGRELNIDGGIVRSWVRGDRVPALGHSCISKIAEIWEIPIREITYHQEKSLIQKQSQRKIKRQTKYISEELKLLACVDKSGRESLAKIEIEDCRYLSAIQGIKKVVGTAISIIEDLPNIPEKNNKILLTFQGRKSCFELQKDLNIKWLNAVREVLQKGWNIEHIIRLDNDWERVILYMSFMLETIGLKGNYHPYCLKQKYVLEPHNGYLIIPGKEALQFFATEQKLHTDAAIYIKDIDQIKIMEKYIVQLQKEAEPIFKRYKTYQQPEFVKAISEADDQPVHRTVILKRLSEITRPLSWYNPYSEWAKALKYFLKFSTDKELAEHLEIRKNRRLKLEKHLNRYRGRYIYTSSCINSFIKTGMASKQNYFTASPQQRVEQLQNMIELLDNPNYEMAILDEKNNDDIFSQIKPSFCEVQGSHVFFMEVWSKNDEGENFSEWFLTHEPTITRAFHEYFSKLWNSIPSKSKDKFELLKRLQQHIQDLEKE